MYYQSHVPCMIWGTDNSYSAQRGSNTYIYIQSKRFHQKLPAFEMLIIPTTCITQEYLQSVTCTVTASLCTPEFTEYADTVYVAPAPRLDRMCVVPGTSTLAAVFPMMPYSMTYFSTATFCVGAVQDKLTVLVVLSVTIKLTGGLGSEDRNTSL